MGNTKIDIIRNELKKGTPLRKISNMVDFDYEKIKYIYHSHPSEICKEEDHICYLGLPYPIYSTMVQHNITSVLSDKRINVLFDRVMNYNHDDIRTDFQYEPINITKDQIGKKKKKQQPQQKKQSVYMTEADYSRDLLHLIMIILQDKQIPKAYIFNDPEDITGNVDLGINVFVNTDNKFVLINSEWIKAQYNMIHQNKFITAIEATNTNIIYKKKYDDKYYSFNRYPRFTKTGNSYIKVFCDTLGTYLNIDIQIDGIIDAPSSDIVEAKADKSNDFFVLSSKSDGDIVTVLWAKQQFCYCKDCYDFQIDLIKGLYIYKKGNIKSGRIQLIPGEKEIKETPEQLRRRVVEYLA